MADTHQKSDSWYEVWFGPEENRRHLKCSDEVEALEQASQLHGSEFVNVEVFKLSINRESVSADFAS